MSRSMFISDTFPWHVTAHFLLSYTDKHKMRQNATLQFERSRFVIQHNTFNTKVDTPSSFIFLETCLKFTICDHVPKFMSCFHGVMDRMFPCLTQKEMKSAFCCHSVCVMALDAICDQSRESLYLSYECVCVRAYG